MACCDFERTDKKAVRTNRKRCVYDLPLISLSRNYHSSQVNFNMTLLAPRPLQPSNTPIFPPRQPSNLIFQSHNLRPCILQFLCETNHTQPSIFEFIEFII